MADAKKVRITLVKSPIGYKEKQRATLQALGLNKMNASREITLTANTQGMINKVIHMLMVEEVQ